MVALRSAGVALHRIASAPAACLSFPLQQLGAMAASPMAGTNTDSATARFEKPGLRSPIAGYMGHVCSYPESLRASSFLSTARLSYHSEAE